MAKASEKREKENTFVTENGLEVKIKKVPPMILQKVMNQVKMPERPMYETAPTVSGRTEVWPLDADSAEQTEHGKARWDYYLEQLESAQAVQNENVTRACFAFGTECEIPEDGWDEIQEELGIEVPPKEKANLRKAHYLMTELGAEDIAELMAMIMRNMSLPEEITTEATASFRGAVRNGSDGPDVVEESGSDS